MANEKIITLDNLATFKGKCDETYAVPDGNYPTMTVGAADSLTPYGENSGAEDNTPFVFQTTGGSSDVGSKAYLRELRGNSVAFNQLVQNGNFSNGTTGWGSSGSTLSAASNVLTLTTTSQAAWVGLYRSVSIINTHKYLIKAKVKCSTNTNYFRMAVGGKNCKTVALTANTQYYYADIIEYDGSGSGYIYIYPNYSTGIGVGETLQIEEVNLFDLTLLGKDYDTVLAFNRDYSKPYYQYNAGTLLSCKVNGIKNVGYNAFDGTTSMTNYYLRSDGVSVSDSDCDVSDYIKVVAGQTYTLEKIQYSNPSICWYDENKNFISGEKYNLNSLGSKDFVAPNNAYYCRFTIVKAQSSVTCFHLKWDGSRTGYEEHEEWRYALPNIELRSVPDYANGGEIYDVAYSTGGGKRRVAIVDLGTLNWTSNNTYGAYSSGINTLAKKPVSNSYKANILITKYENTYRSAFDNSSSLLICIDSSGDLDIQDTSLRNKTNAEIQALLSGTILYYELATETDITIEENPGWQNPQDIDDFGTQEFLYDNNINVPVPQGNDFFYPVDYKAFVDSLGGREDIEYAADQVVSQDQLQTALSTFLSSISGYDATKTQTLKNVNGVFQWVDD